MSNYERFQDDGAAVIVPNSESRNVQQHDIEDVQIKMSESDGKVQFYPNGEKYPGKDYVKDPAGDKFSPKSKLE